MVRIKLRISATECSCARSVGQWAPRAICIGAQREMIARFSTPGTFVLQRRKGVPVNRRVLIRITHYRCVDLSVWSWALRASERTVATGPSETQDCELYRSGETVGLSPTIPTDQFLTCRRRL
jgi:hypothetical protein